METVAPDRVERAATTVMILAAPLFVAGIAAVITVILLIVAVPLLLVSTPVLLIAGRARRAPEDPDQRYRLALVTFAFAVVLTGGLVAAVVAWRDDFDPPLSWVLLGLGLAWVAAAWVPVRMLGPDALREPAA
ncbi:MAG: hypothetical protein ACR2O6_11345 [Ilumatobacteraceae bacterium]